MKAPSLPTCSHEPIAIIGIGCRFPGGIVCPRSFWRLLCEGGDAITEAPENRWDLKAFYDPERERAGKVYTRRGGFLGNIDRFEPQFFGISPREAAYMDPQQRLLLEATWSAFEDGGYPPGKLAGRNIGVFIGLFMHDYENIHCGAIERKLFGPHSATGMSATISANRISYIYDFKGPSLIVDTACSSSLVAVHLACRSLAENESQMAIAGGVNLQIRPEMNMVLCKGSFLSPDGRCKAFDARADGYVRSEGVAIVVLKRLSDALADNDDIYAIIRGTAVNQDGHNEGLTVPNADAQIDVIREALRRAGKRPADIQYVEAHGTGTAVGDPVETRALGTVFGEHRPADHPLVIGSVKTNIGHTESAAGVAGLIKTALMLRNGFIPPNLHFETPNPNIEFDTWKLRVPTMLEPWPCNGDEKIRCAAVNSFGFGGTNAHAILEHYESASNKPVDPMAVFQADKDERMAVVPLSAHSPEALKAMVQSLHSYFSTEDAACLSPADVGRTTSLHREQHACRLSIAAQSMPELIDGLDAYLGDEQRPGMVTGRADLKKSSRLAFIYSGMGQQWPGMGRKLYESEPVFRETLDECNAILGKYSDEWSLLSALFADEAESRFDETQIAQPAIVAIGIGITSLWRSWGIQPEVVMGHSVGEIAACHAAGILTLEDTLRLAFYRSLYQHRLTGKGTMLAVGLPVQEAEYLLNGHEKLVSIAAINGPSNVTLSGETAALQEIAFLCERDRIFARFLNVTVPFHSVFMDSILEESERSLAGIDPRPSHTTLVSTVTGEAIDWKEITVAYWLRNMRDPVLFAPAFSRLLHAGYDVFIEISAHPVLATPMRDCITGFDGKKWVIPTLRRGEQDNAMAYGSLGQLFAAGYPIDWQVVFKDRGKFVRLPPYEWRGDRFWTESEESMQTRIGSHAPGNTGVIGPKVHPLLGGLFNAAKKTWNADIGLSEFSYLRDHVVQQSVVYPAAAYLETALAAAEELYSDGSSIVREVEIKAPLLMTEERETTVQTTIDPDGTFSVYAKIPGDPKNWALHVQGSLMRIHEEDEPPALDVDALESKFDTLRSAETHYRSYRLRGIDYGPCFRAVESIHHNGNEALGRIRLPDMLAGSLDDYLLHPVILDAGFQVTGSIESGGAYLPVRIDTLRFYRRPGSTVWCHSRLTDRSENSIRGDLVFYTDGGLPVAEVRGLTCRLVQDEQGFRPDSISRLLYTYEWLPDSARGNAPNPDYLPSPRSIANLMKDAMAAAIDGFDRCRYYEVVAPEFNRLCSSYILRALKNCGGGLLSLEGCAERLGVVPEHRRLLNRLLDILAEDGLALKKSDGWMIADAGDGEDADAIWRSLIGNFASYHAELTLLGRCGPRLLEVMRGETDPLSLIFPHSFAAAEHLYHTSPTFRIYNHLMQQAVGIILDSLPGDRNLRVLEIGAGTGAMTSHLLPLLPPHRTRYVFSDISAGFAAQAEQKFSNYPFVEFRSLDIEKNPLEQGFEPHSFDLIVAADVLHATSVLGETFAHVKTLLAPGGMLALLEATNPPRWFDLVFGMLKGWWLFSDTHLRPSHPLLSQRKWLAFLSSAGFSDAACIPDREGEHEPLHSIILARGPDSESASKAAEINAALSSNSSNPWLILSSGGGMAERISDLLKTRGIKPFIVSNAGGFSANGDEHASMNPDRPEDIAAMLDALCPEAAAPPMIVNLWGIDGPSEDMTAAWLNRFMNESCRWTLHLVQALTVRQWTGLPRMYMITAGSQAAGGHMDLALASAPLWGFGRVMTTELAGIETRMVDLDPEPSDRNLASLLAEFLSPDAEDEIALRGGRRFIHRLIRDNAAVCRNSPSHPFMLKYSKGFEGFEFTETVRRKPKPDQVEIDVRAAGINFKDVAKVSGLLNEAALERSGLPPHLGMECSGVVTAVGEKEHGFSEGDEVMGIVLNCFASHATTIADVLVRKPSSLSFEDAATVPLVFLTAWHALKELGRARKGDRILIHTGAGSVGLAAIQIARAAGAEVIATAGSPEKREYLRNLGIACVADSRSSSFASEIEKAVGPESIDIILNTLPPSTIPFSISLLKSSSGRFIDIGNVYERALSLPSPAKGISFHSFALERMIVQNRDYVRSMLQEIVRGFESGMFHPLPHRVFPMAEISGAFRAIRKGTNIGKVVLSTHSSDLALNPDLAAIAANPTATYLVTGGLGGFGLAVARWLVDCGARHLVLCGRSGASTPRAQKEVSSLKNGDIQVIVEQVDVADEAQVAAMLDRIHASMPPLRGIIHGAMVLDDVPIMNMKDEQLERVLNPKALGAWNLHRLTLGSPLDFFVCFSSFSAMVGNSEQANYVAANLFLDSLAHYRAARGLAALSINWGPLGDVGYVAQHSEIREHFYHQGIGELTLVQAWKTIAAALNRGKTQIGVSPANWRKFSRYSLSVGRSPVYSFLVKHSVSEKDQTKQTLISLDAASSPEELRQMIEESMSREVARIMGIPPDKLARDQSLDQLGFDSLMAVELVVAIETLTGFSLPKMTLLQPGLTVAELAEIVFKQRSAEKFLKHADGAKTSASAPVPGSRQTIMEADAPQVDINAMSDEQVNALLSSLLSDGIRP